MTEPEAVVPQVPEPYAAYIRSAQGKHSLRHGDIHWVTDMGHALGAAEATIAQQAATIERLTDALEHIKQHQEIVAGNMCGHTSAWTIANTALNYREKI